VTRAVVVERFGPPEVMQVRDVPAPGAPGPGQVLVEVHAAGVNPVDASNRSDGAWAQITLPYTPGSDASGQVAAVGEGVSGLVPGDEVFYFTDFLGTSQGSYAEQQLVPAEQVAAKPAGISHVEAASIPLAGGTAYEVARRLGVDRDQWLLVFGASGGVGSFLVQIAKARGASVAAVASAANHEYLRDLGADLTVDYRDGDAVGRVAAELGSVDAAADLVGGDVVERSLEVVREGGNVASICALTGSFEPAVDRNISLHGVLVRPQGERGHGRGRVVLAVVG
jgi:NADPH2:quinone reductase